MHPVDWDESEETEDKTSLISSSVDHLTIWWLGTKETKKIPRANLVQPPKIRTKVFKDTFSAVDSSWEFIGNEGDDCDLDYDSDADYEGDNVPSMQWSLGWVIKVYPGTGDIIRTATA